MPLYIYHCPNCSAQETRVAGVDDRVVRCLVCGCEMQRPDDPDSIFIAYR